jgi:hypothetical protein
MRDERAHTELPGQGEGLLVVLSGMLDLWGLSLRSDLPEKPERVCQVSPLFVLVRQFKGTLGKLASLIKASIQQMGFT